MARVCVSGRSVSSLVLDGGGATTLDVYIQGVLFPSISSWKFDCTQTKLPPFSSSQF